MDTDFSNIDEVLSPVFSRHLQSKAYSSFLKRIANGGGRYSAAAFSFPLKAYDPLACLELFGTPGAFRFYWEKPEDGFALSGGDALIRITGSGKDRFQQVSRKIGALAEKTVEFSPVNHSYAGLYYLGGFSFFDRDGTGQWKQFDAASFTVPKWLIVKDGNLGMLTIAADLSGSPSETEIDRYLRRQLRRFSKLFDLKQVAIEEEPGATEIISDDRTNPVKREQWLNSVEQAGNHIRAGAFEKIVLARETEIETGRPISPTLVLNRLRQKYPNCYSFLVENENSATFIGSSPERLAKFRKQFMLTEALAGSIQRGSSATDDSVFEERLLQSSKELSEHNFVVTSIAERLEPYAGRIEKGSDPLVKKLTNVQHLYTPITVWLNEDADRLSVLESLHPTPAVGGYPWNKAAGYLHELEHFDRGWYAAPVGWLNNHACGEFSVSIRSALVEGNKARFFAGCGIVEDSEPLNEWEETNLKLMPMLSALQYE